MIRIITSLVAVLTVASIQSQTTLKDTPKLVIGITIDQLRGDYLELFKHSFSERGFNRLLNEGLVYSNIRFEYPNVNEASSIATIYTGTNPFYHGIIGKTKFSADKNTESPIFDDNSFIGNYTKEKLSPAALRVSTIADELKFASQNKSEIYAFAPNSFQAIISGGHQANGVYWIEDYTGKWATSTFYKDFHWTVDQQNRNGIFSNHPESLRWQLLLGAEKYNTSPYGGDFKYLDYIWKTNSTNLYSQLKETPFANENTTKTAIDLMLKTDMGKHSYPDFLAITYYAGNYTAANSLDYSVEQQDIYIRLDKDIASLLDQVEKTVGLQNTLIFVTSTGYYNSNYIITETSKQSTGVFYTNRCEALLNMYLMAVYGKEQWVERYHDQQIYLNRKLIESKNINLKEIQDKAAEFVIQFTGVQDATTSLRLLSGETNLNMSSYRNMLDKTLSGDIIVEIQPGYQIVDEKNPTQQTQIQREAAIVAPVIFWGYNIKPEKIKRTVKATEIAPTISKVLRIRSPNAAKDQPLPEFM